MNAPPVLYLRSFHDDDKTTQTLLTASILLPKLILDMMASPEEQLSLATNKIGPMIAIGKPGEKLPLLGAQRLYVENDHWQEAVSKLMENAQLVVLRAGTSAGLWWEFKKAFSLHPPAKLAVLIYMSGKDYLLFKENFQREINLELPEAKAISSRRHRYGFIFFDQNWQAWFEPLRTPFFRTPFFRPLVSAFEAALHPFFIANQLQPPPRPIAKGKVFFLLTFLGLFLMLLWAASFTKKLAERRGKIEVYVEEVQRRTILESVSASGKIFPETEIRICAYVSGEVVELYVREGDSVAAGQVLAKIRPDEYQSAVERGQAAVAGAKALRESSLANKDTPDTQIAKLASENARIAESGVADAEAALEELRAGLQKTIITAPISGTVSKLNIKKGERVVGTVQMTGTEMLRIANPRSMELQVVISENDISKIAVGNGANIEADGYPGRKFRGKVTEIAGSASKFLSSGRLNTDQVTNFVVKIHIDPASYADLPKNPFQPGISASADIRTRTSENTLSVPLIAVTASEGGAGLTTDEPADKEETYHFKEIVFAVRGDSVNACPVKTGIQDNDYIEILSGLEEGEKVVAGPYSAIVRHLKGGSRILIAEPRKQ